MCLSIPMPPPPPPVPLLNYVHLKTGTILYICNVGGKLSDREKNGNKNVLAQNIKQDVEMSG
jgi:hypothetical protein